MPYLLLLLMFHVHTQSGWQTPSGDTSGSNEAPHPMSCLDSRVACRIDTHCQRMLDAIDIHCPIALDDCEPDRYKSCSSVQKWLQYNHIFRDCHCRLNAEQSRECMNIRNRIYNNPCPHLSIAPVRHHHGNERTRHTVRETHKRDQYEDYEDFPEFGEDDEEEEDDLFDAFTEEGDPDENSRTCIGIRSQCLQNATCSDTLSDFRRLCYDSKRQGRCVSPDREGCLEAINKLKILIPGLFMCQCNIRKDRTQRKCERIQYRLANNSCLVTVPYLVYTPTDIAATFDDLLKIASTSEGRLTNRPIILNTSEGQMESTCVQAFFACRSDSKCLQKLQTYMSICHWNAEAATCERTMCLRAINNFYLMVRAELSTSLLFCQCIPGDYACRAVRSALYPTCARIQIPPPSCHDILEECEADKECRTKWHSYEENCYYDKFNGGCTNTPAMCRSAQLGIMGTILTTNCTCHHLEHDEEISCNNARQRLQHDNVCKELALKDFAKHRPTTEPMINTGTGIPSQECLRQLSKNKIPGFMSTPSHVRKYRNDSECSELCTCGERGIMQCRKLPCLPWQTCNDINTDKNKTAEHGETYIKPDRGHCRCIRSEVVCARPKRMPSKQRTGLFILLGYSIKDRKLIESNSDLRFNVDVVSHKLAALLNGDTAEQFCRLSTYHSEPGNIIFEVRLPPQLQSSSIRENCEYPSQTLGKKINSRWPEITADAELSVIKVAEMEILQRHTFPLPPAESSSSRLSIGHQTASSSRTLLALLILLSCYS